MPFLHPDIAIKNLDIIPGMRIADFGCGAGHWTVALARLAGAGGRVYAFDVQESALESTRSLARSARLQNIETVRANLEIPGSSALRDGSVDMVLLCNILFQAEQKDVIAAEATRIIKSGGRAVVVEWDETDSLAGPPVRQRVTRQTAEQLFTSSGLRFEKEFNTGSHHYGLIFRKA